MRHDLHIPHMHIRDSVKLNIAEYTGETEEILILAPGAGRKAEDLDGEAVFIFIIDIRRQIELGRGEAVLGIPDIVPVQPERKTALDTLKGNENLPALHHLRYKEEMHIARRRIVLRRDLPRADRLMPVPGILRVDVSRRPVPLQFEVSGHPDVIPARDIIICPIEILRRLCDIGSPGKLPDAVQ